MTHASVSTVFTVRQDLTNDLNRGRKRRTKHRVTLAAENSWGMRNQRQADGCCGWLPRSPGRPGRSPGGPVKVDPGSLTISKDSAHRLRLGTPAHSCSKMWGILRHEAGGEAAAHGSFCKRHSRHSQRRLRFDSRLRCRRWGEGMKTQAMS